MKTTLPGGASIEQINAAETSFLIQEIFERQVYPIPSMRDIACPVILDLGANIGVFAHYALHSCPGSRVICVEPVPPVADILAHNLAPLGSRAKVLRCAVGGAPGEMNVTYYPGYSIMSRLGGDEMEDRKLLNSCLRQDLQSKMKHPRVLGEHHVETMVEERLGDIQTFACQVLTLPAIIEQEEIASVDYLKMDVEGAELEILQSLPGECWAMIHHLGLEVHEHTESSRVLDTIEGILRANGYATRVGDVAGIDYPRTVMLYGSRL